MLPCLRVRPFSEARALPSRRSPSQPRRGRTVLGQYTRLYSTTLASVVPDGLINIQCASHVNVSSEALKHSGATVCTHGAPQGLVARESLDRVGEGHWILRHCEQTRATLLDTFAYYPTAASYDRNTTAHRLT